VIARPDLERLVQDLAGRPEEWAHLVEHRADARTYAELRRDEHVGVWLICWMNDHDTGYHDHDLSSGAVAAGGSFTFGPADIHRVIHAGSEPAVTLHAYSPPLWRMGSYEVLETGELRRWSLSYAEELRPIGAEK
jgi:hypothetical protein